MTKFDFLSESIWPEIAFALVQIPKIFNPAFTQMFQQNYLATTEFMQHLETYCFCLQHGTNLRKQQTEFLKKWNLPVYFQLRFQEIVGKCEQVLGTSESWSPLVHPVFLLKGTSTVWECCEKCFALDVFLVQLLHRSYKLSIQILLRYKLWVQDIIDRAQQPTSENTSGILVASLLHDLEVLIQKLSNFATSIIQPLVRGDQGLSMELQGSYDEFATSLSPVRTSIATLLLKPVVKKCVDLLLPLKGITAAYRMTNKSVPVRSSIYADNITSPVDEFVKDLKQIPALQKFQIMWVEQILEQVVEKYIEMIRELLSTFEKAEAVRKKMVKKSQTSHSAATQTLSDMDKIFIQLSFDVDSFGNQFANFGIDKTNFLPFQQLLAVVSPGLKLREELKTAEM